MAPVFSSPSGRDGPIKHGQQPGAPRRGGSATYLGSVTAPAPAPESIWPDNEPGGLTPVFGNPPTGRPAGTMVDGSEVFFDYTGSGGDDIGAPFSFGAKWDGGPRVLTTTSAGSRYPTVIRKNLFIGDPSGFNGVATLQNFADDYEILYMRCIFRYSDNWEFNAQNEKLWYFGKAGAGGSGFYVGVSHGGGNASGENVLALINQASNAGDGGEWRTESSEGFLTVGEWETVELLVTAQSAVGVADGSFQMWLNDVEVASWPCCSGQPNPANTVEWYNSSSTTRLFSGLQYFVYWGGQGPPKTVNDHVDCAEFYITGKVATS